jgi:hypothetical protein
MSSSYSFIPDSSALELAQDIAFATKENTLDFYLLSINVSIKTANILLEIRANPSQLE